MHLTPSGGGVLGTFPPNLSAVHSRVTEYKESTDTALPMARGQREQVALRAGAQRCSDLRPNDSTQRAPSEQQCRYLVQGRQWEREVVRNRRVKSVLIPCHTFSGVTWGTS